MSMPSLPSASRLPHQPPRRRRLPQAVLAALALAPALAWADPSPAPNVQFNTSFLFSTGGQDIDVSRFEQGNAVMPGNYRADIQVNGRWVARTDLRFEAAEGEPRLCLTPELVADFGIDFERLAGYVQQQGLGQTVLPVPEGEFCGELDRYLPQASTRFDPNELLLEVSIPQLYLARNPRGWVSPERWERGANAFRLGYSFNHQQGRFAGQDRANTYLGLEAGLNLGGWRLHHNGHYTRSDSADGRYRAGRTYAQHDLTAWGAQLTVGDTYTYGDLFDGIAFRGVSIASDERMLPDSQRGYAPAVRGVAQTNARVTVRQRDQVIYETTVAPGPFVIEDLYDTSYGGDLQVTVTEADGREHAFTVPFAAVPRLLREGQNRFSLVAGQVKDSNLRDAPGMVEATWQRGLSNAFTGFAGTTLSDGYGALLLGGAYNTSWGAFSGDVSFSRTSLNGSEEGGSLSGQSARLTYSKHLQDIGTNFSLAAYRYSTDGYLNLSDGLRLRQYLDDGAGLDELARQRSRLDLTVNQALGDSTGSLYFNGSTANYWNRDQRTTSYSLGYSNRIGKASYSVSAQRTVESFALSADSRQSNSINFNLNMPLGKSSRPANFSSSLGRSSSGGADARVGLSGTLGQDRALSYGVSASHREGQDTAFNGNLDYSAPFANLSAGYSHNGAFRQLSLGAAGGVLAHAGGVNFSQRLGETIGVLHVPGASNVKVGGTGVGLRTNRNGYAVVPYLTPYRVNDVTVDPKGLPLELELKHTSARTAPRAGAVVQLAIETESGRTALIQAWRANGQPLPFGTDVYQGERVVGVVGQASRIWVRGVEEQGRLSVRWGAASQGERCGIQYDLAGVEAGTLVSAECVAQLTASAPGGGGSEGDVAAEQE